MRDRLRWLPAVIVAITIYALSVGPGTVTSPASGTPLFGMTARHIAAYAGLAATIVYGYRFDHSRLLHAALIAAVFGFLVEINQFFLPYRYFSLADIGANTAGAASVLVLRVLPVDRLER